MCYTVYDAVFILVPRGPCCPLRGHTVGTDLSTVVDSPFRSTSFTDDTSNFHVILIRPTCLLGGTRSSISRLFRTSNFFYLSSRLFYFDISGHLRSSVSRNRTKHFLKYEKRLSYPSVTTCTRESLYFKFTSRDSILL